MRGARGRQLDASISRAVKEVQAAQRARFMKPKEQVRAEAATRKAAKEAAAASKPKRVRTPESLRLSRAKQVEKRRSINISNPAGYRAEASGRMAANAARTQQRALAFYGQKSNKQLKPKGLKQGAVTARLQAKAVKRSKPDLSQSSFERRALATEKRAKIAEKAVGAVDRYNPSNRKLVNRANSLRSAADSYASYARRGKNNPDFSAADLFKGRRKSSTSPKLTPSEKAAVTRRAKADKRFKENVRKMEQDRRR